MSEASDQLYTLIYNRSHTPPHSYNPTTTSATINARNRSRSPDSSHSQYPNTRLRHDAPPFVPRPPKFITRTTNRQLRWFGIFPNPRRKKIDGKSDNARIRVARQPLRKRLRLLQKIKEVEIVAETLNIIASRKFLALCNLVGITAIPREQQPRRMVNAHLHVAPLRYPKIVLPLDGSAAWKQLKKHQVAGHISKQRFNTLLHRHIARLATS